MRYINPTAQNTARIGAINVVLYIGTFCSYRTAAIVRIPKNMKNPDIYGIIDVVDGATTVEFILHTTPRC
jgi:hypothetical protein